MTFSDLRPKGHLVAACKPGLLPGRSDIGGAGVDAEVWGLIVSLTRSWALRILNDTSYTVYICHVLARVIALGVLLPLALPLPLLTLGTLESGMTDREVYFAFQRPAVPYFPRRRRTWPRRA